MQSIPPGISLSKKHATPNVVVVVMGSVQSRDGLIVGRTGNRKTCLSDPDGLSLSDIFRGLEGLAEKRSKIRRPVIIGGLKIGKPIHADKIRCRDDRAV